MRNINKVLLLIVLFSTIICKSALFAADAAQYGTPFSGVPDPRDVSIYQVSVGQYSSSRNLQGVINGLDNIKALGVNVIYLMPTYPVGVSGSPYSITDFGGVDPKIGTLTDLRNLVDGAHARGMAVIMDWVSYETAADHPWVTSHPEYYKKDANGNMVHPFPDCTALDTSNPTVANMMIQYMRDWVFKANIDGFRCDWADYSEPSYWTNIINNLRSITSHKLLMFAEGSNEGTSSGCSTCGNNQPGYHYAQGFDLIFGESFYWNFMKKCYLNGESAKNVDGITTGEYVGASSTQLVARYMSNHDEYGSDGSPFNWMGGKKQVLSSFVVAAYMRGVPFIYNGLEVGNTSALPYPWNTGLINWTQDLTVLTSIKQILAFRNSSDAIRRGTPTSYTTDNVVAFTKTSAAQTAFVAVNIRNSNQTFTLPAGIANTTMYDGFSNTSVALGTTITLAPYEYRAFVNSVVKVTSVSLSPTSASISGTGTQQLTATILPSNATNKSVTYTSSNSSVATVNSSTGLVTGVAPGTATITVTTNDGAKKATCAITVQPLTQFTVYFQKPAAWGTGIKVYYWSAQPAGSIADASWPGVNMTLTNGWYSYTFTGATSINLIFNDGTNQSADLSRSKNGWYVDGVWYDSQPSGIAVTGVSVTPTTASIVNGATTQLTATVAPSNATNKTVTWSSSNSAVATVSSTGLVTAVNAGTATITVTTTDGAKTASAILASIKTEQKNC